MNSRERVLKTINHQEPDRLPVFQPNLIPTHEPLDERVQHFLDTFEFDRFVGLGGYRQAHPEAKRDLGNGEYDDAYGCRFKYMGVGSAYGTHHPLAEVKTVTEIEQYPWPQVDGMDLVMPEAKARAKQIREHGEYVTSVGVGMLFHRYHWLRGFEQWMFDLKLNPEIHKAIADRVYHINSTLALSLLEQVGEYTDIVTMGDDFGTSIAPYMSPKDFQTHIKPYYQDLIARIKERHSHIKFYLHSHGQIMDLVPDLLECGVDILNPILPLDNMDPRRLKASYGDRLSFEGGIDIEAILVFGTVDEVKEHVREVIDILAPGGGFLFKAQAISRLIPYDNLMAAYDLALDYGLY